MAGYTVFIVEDNGSKLQEIRAALRHEISGEPLTTSSIANAYRVMANADFDLVILDMTFEVSSELGSVAKESLAGIELLQYMGRMGLSVPVIVATQHTTFYTPELPGIDSIEKLDELLKELFPANYFTTVHVDLAGEVWKTELVSATRRALARGRGRAS